MIKLAVFVLLIYSAVNGQSTISYSVSGSNFGSPNIAIESLYWRFFENDDYLIAAITQGRYTAYKNANGTIRQIDFNTVRSNHQNAFIHISNDFYRFIYYSADSLFVFYTDENLTLLSSIRANIANIEQITPIGNNAYALLQRNNSELNIVFLNVTLNQTNAITNSGLVITENSQLYLKEIDSNRVLIFGPTSTTNTHRALVYSSTGTEIFSANISANNLHRVSAKLYEGGIVRFSGIFSGSLNYNGAAIASTILPTDNRLFIFAVNLNDNVATAVRTSLFTSPIPNIIVPAGANSVVAVSPATDNREILSKIDVSPLAILWQFDATGNNFSISQVNAINDSVVYFSGNVSGTITYGGTQLTSQGVTDAFYIKVTDRRLLTSIAEVAESIGEVPTIENISPNPSNPISLISYNMPHSDNIAIEVFDINGRIVKTLEAGLKQKGTHSVVFDGAKLSSGIYFVRLSHSKGSKSHRITLIK